MAGMTLNQYLQQMENAIDGSDGVRASQLLSFNHAHIASPRLQIESPESQCQRWFEPPWDELVAAHLRCCWAVANHNFIEAYGCQSIVVSAFVKLFQAQKDENWALPILFSVALDIRIFANNADTQLASRGRGKPGETLEKAADSLMACFRVCASDNRAAPDDSKKWGMLNLVNQLFKIYFKINKLHLCRPLTRAIESLPIREKFSISQMVTYRYYVGRKAIFENDFKQADEYLSYAFQRCHRAAKCNKRLILIYLLPVKMLLGQMPKPTLLQKYDLLQFSEVTQGVRSGNLLQLNEALKKNATFFIQSGVYLILEKLKTITYRNLAKKVALLLGTHQLNVSAFTTALKWMQHEDEDIDDDEVQCILANLIYDNKIKGYISHQHRKLVISKQNAFPSITTQ